MQFFQQLELPDHKRCRVCGISKPLGDFYAKGNSCKRCCTTRALARHRANPGATVEARRRRIARDPEAFQRQRAKHDARYQQARKSQNQPSLL